MYKKLLVWQNIRLKSKNIVPKKWIIIKWCFRTCLKSLSSCFLIIAVNTGQNGLCKCLQECSWTKATPSEQFWKNFSIYFKLMHLNIKIEYSKFGSLHPKWCILSGKTSTHPVRACVYLAFYTNLMVGAMGKIESYEDLTCELVCST